jgi:hypothetical protein
VGRAVFLLAKISPSKDVEGAKFIYVDTDGLSEMEQHDWAWAVGLKEHPGFFPENKEKTTILKGNGMFSRSNVSGVESGVESEFFTVLYRWEGRFRF